MALAEGGIFAALIGLIGMMPKREFALPPPVYPVIEVEPDDLSADVSGHPSDVSDRPTSPPTKLASTRAFVKWWRTVSEVPNEVTQRYLCALYGEFCEHEHLVPLSDRQLLNKIKQHGVESYRPPARIVRGKMHRPTFYKLKRAR